MSSDGQPGQNQSHDVPEEGQVSGKQIPVQLRRTSLGAQHHLHLSGHPDFCIRGFSLSVKALHEIVWHFMSSNHGLAN